MFLDFFMLNGHCDLEWVLKIKFLFVVTVVN